MRIPELPDELKRRINEGPCVSIEDRDISIGMPLFVKEDVHVTNHHLDVLLRTVFVNKNISNDYFLRKSRKYAIEVESLMGNQVNSFAFGLRNALLKGHITYARFTTAFDVMGFTLLDTTVEFRSNTGDIQAVSVSGSYM